MLTADCQRFCNRFTSHQAPNGKYMSLRVVQAWTIAETSGGISGVRGYNFINIGNTDSNPEGGPRWTSPEEAADASFQWLIDNPLSGKPILDVAGAGDTVQLRGIYTSPFSSSHYGPPGQPGVWLLADYQALNPPPAPTVMKPPTVIAAPTHWEDTMQSVKVHVPALDAHGDGWEMIPGAAGRVICVTPNGADPVTNGYQPIPQFAPLDNGVDAKVVILGGAPGGELDFTVWLASAP